jgi:localization factor PodJL
MAMHNLAALYAGGALDSQDFGSAAFWFEKAANLGVKDSQFNLGMLYARGLGVTQDFIKSYMWFDLAAQTGDQDAAAARDDIARSLDANALELARGMVTNWQIGIVDIPANYAPIGTWDANFDAGIAIGDPEIIAQVQEILGKLGYDIGAPDGVIGPKTEIAIRAFESATGMNETGRINPRLLAVLGSQPV